MTYCDVTPTQARLHAEHLARVARMRPVRVVAIVPTAVLEPEPEPSIPIPPPAPAEPALTWPRPAWWTPDAEVPKPITASRIILAVCTVFDIRRNDLLSCRRTRCLVRPRQAVMLLAREMTLLALTQIGRVLGNRDHTTILHGCRKAGMLMLCDPEFAAKVQCVREELRARGGA